MQERARENLAQNALTRMRNSVPGDGFEAGNIYLQQQAAANYYNGQFRPQKVFDLAAWAKFVQAWKRGDFKRKKKKAADLNNDDMNWIGMVGIGLGP